MRAADAPRVPPPPPPLPLAILPQPWDCLTDAVLEGIEHLPDGTARVGVFSAGRWLRLAAPRVRLIGSPQPGNPATLLVLGDGTLSVCAGPVVLAPA